MIHEIETGIPAPAGKHNYRSEITEKARPMKKGHSRLCDKKSEARQLGVRLNQFGRKTVTREENGKFRVWVVG